ncbi:MAG: CRTAC1 family protein [Planctomycetota bacterium]|jgi:hypothetical protein
MILLVAAIAAVASPTPGHRFIDVTDDVGLGADVVGTAISRCCFADVNGDGRADAIVDRHRVFLNVADDTGASVIGRRFVEVPDCGLPRPQAGDITVFADIDNDGPLDAIVTRYIDLHNESWTDDGQRTRWLPGQGDGTFGEARPITLAPPATTSAIAAGDLNHDGRLDLWLGNWYVHYGESLAGYPNDLLLQEPPGWQAARLPPGPPVGLDLDEDTDLAGRPTYGAMIADLDGLGRPELLELNYGRRWNRCHLWLTSPDGDPPARWTDIAPRAGLDGDDVRHGRYPEWLQERAKEEPRFDRDDEKPFRANGNTFDCAVGDIDSDGDFDLFLSEITHAWAGDSSDPSRFLLSRLRETGRLEFEYDPRLSVDRVPAEGNQWNQGDLFCALADMDNDGRLDLLLSSGDYPDDERLRLYRQQADGTFADVTAEVGLDHDGSQMISLADVEGDGDLDILVGQTFFRYTPEMKAGRQPRLRLFVNETPAGAHGLTLRLEGDPDLGTNRDALGAVVKATVGSVTMQRQLVGVGGHSGKQQDFVVHFGLGPAERVDKLVVVWPDAARTTQTFAGVVVGRYTLRQGEALRSGRGGGEGYAGLKLRDIPGGHTVVSWILPGPLQGEGLTAPAFDLGRPDLVVAVDGRPMNAEQFRELVRSASPGVRINLEYRRSRSRGGGIPDDLDHEDEVQTVEIVIASRDEWLGTIGRTRSHEAVATIDKPYLLDPFDAENLFGAAVAEHGLAEPIEDLVGVFDEWLEKGDDYHSLSRFRLAFKNPFQLPEVGQLVVGSLEGLNRYGPSFMLNAAARNLDVPSGWGDGARDASHRLVRSVGPERTVATRLARVMAYSEQLRHQALGDLADDEAFARQCAALLRLPRRDFYITGAGAKPHIDVIRRSIDVEFGTLVRSFLFDWELEDGAIAQEGGGGSRGGVEVPDELAGAVSGPIRGAYLYEPVGWIVIGTEQANRYDMARVAAVVDAGGDDEYYATGLRLGCRMIIDLEGDDLYTGTPQQGPGGALLGVSLIDDRAGDDRYEGDLLSAGAAMYGVSLLVDRDGNDIYVGKEWSLGAACYGAGMILDLGGGDTYLGEFLCQGVGGPRGFGCIVDASGRDLYRANGPEPSAYGTPAVYQAFSQGVGFGFRHYAAGGIGLISDRGGDDRYEAGEFAQGGAYYYALGILHDAAGRDIYYGNRYAQGFAAHQAIGILADDAGDDTYWGMTAASQGAAWDVSAGLLIDRGGNDSYQADGLAQGAASMQAIGVLADLGGTDRYAAGGGAVQGRSGGNTYHYHETGAFSFSVLLDLGGADDWYSTDRSDGSTVSTGVPKEDRPQDSPLHGLFIDR